MTLRLLPFLALFVAAAAAAQQPPNAGQLLQQLQPALRPPVQRAPAAAVQESSTATPADGPRLAVTGFVVTGATVFVADELAALLADGVGRELALADLDALAQRITRHYRAAGYLVARAYLPAQEIVGGRVRVDVLEGVLGEVLVVNAAGIGGAALAPLSALARGAALRQEPLERRLLALAELPGVEVRSTLRPGTALGASDLLVEILPGRALTGTVDFDSFGNRFTGAHRLGASLSLNNPLALGDQASVRVQASDAAMHYARIGYQLPVGVAGARIGAAWSAMHYALGEDYADLRADGTARVASLYLQHPLLRRRDASLTLSLQYDAKHLTDRIGATAVRTEKSLGNWTAALAGSCGDELGGGGTTTIALSYITGRLDMDAAAAAIDRVTARSAGGFAYGSLSAHRLQALVGNVSLWLAWSEQWAGKNLNSSEQFSLGGVQGVRAYPQGEASGDAGRLLNAELRWQVAPAWQLQAFYDAGQVTLNRAPWAAGDNRRHRVGVGVGAGYAADGLTLRAFAAWRAGAGETTSDVERRPRIWVQVVQTF